MTQILGRPYVLFDPEQTAEIKRKEREAELQRKITEAFNAVLDAIDNYVQENAPDIPLHNTVRDAVKKIRHVAGEEFYEDLDAYCELEELLTVKWNGDDDE